MPFDGALENNALKRLPSFAVILIIREIWFFHKVTGVCIVGFRGVKREKRQMQIIHSYNH